MKRSNRPDRDVVKPGSTVVFEYVGIKSDGEVFDKATADNPLKFTVGDGTVPEGVETSVLGMTPGESKTAVVPPEKAFGKRSTDRVLTVPKEKLPTEREPHVGDQFELSIRNGETWTATVQTISEDEVVLDANHPLAGEMLTLNLRLLAVE